MNLWKPNSTLPIQICICIHLRHSNVFVSAPVLTRRGHRTTLSNPSARYSVFEPGTIVTWHYWNNGPTIQGFSASTEPFFSSEPRKPACGREEPWYHTSIQPGVFLLLRSSACRSHPRQLYGSTSFCLTAVRWTSLLSSSSLVPLFSPLHRAILHSFGIINDNPSVHLSSSKWSVY